MNLLENINYAVEKKTFITGIRTYTQSNCQCSLTDDGFRIYRTPNAPYPGSGQTMWGGLVLSPELANSGCLQTSHSYAIVMDVMGRSSGAMSDLAINNMCGWSPSDSGLLPAPTDVVRLNPVTANFSSSTWQTLVEKWTIPANDSIYKVCTKAYSSYVVGNTYLSYKDFKFGYTYADTGEWGTDIYLKNIRMYDITNMANMDIRKTGVAEYIAMIENESSKGNVSVFKFGEIRADNFYEI